MMGKARQMYALSLAATGSVLWLLLASCMACSSAGKDSIGSGSRGESERTGVRPADARAGSASEQTEGHGETTMDASPPFRRDARPIIQARSHAAHRQEGGHWELRILWQVENPADRPLFLLLAQPLSTRVADPLVLDHSSHGGQWTARPHVIPGFEIVEIAPGQQFERETTYRVSIPAESSEVSVVGRFGYSHTAPSPDWVPKKSWKQVAQWQSIVDATPVTIRFR